MDEMTAISILGLNWEEIEYAKLNPGSKTVQLDGHFTSEQLEAIAWWMDHKRE
jgi:hypothetical protein